VTPRAAQAAFRVFRHTFDAGWSSPVARQAHNLKAAGSNPAPATKLNCETPVLAAGVFVWAILQGFQRVRRSARQLTKRRYISA
jgi:hypothetical protein